ncbi:nuclear transport factor 2 family protein [Parahaliea maris]|uniref:Nuclear transport factor 2 family protein n=1 Tax=Parahaliea maris TaxID=2716870 RepID=A0A5C9A8S9_9GAMM|nr:nuclear transport factor 2 family protein [Parahaliea maris]TXS96549.1 nuclear transport factor 2 family protein [Parahaliea maris]
MSSTQDAFFAYAAAFEETFKDDDWDRLRPFFTDDAVYEVVGGPMACRITGVDAILNGLKRSVDGFDRQMDNRQLDVPTPPVIEGNSIRLDWIVTYARGDSPPGELIGHSEATLSDGKIVLLRDIYRDEELQPFGEWLQRYVSDLDGSYV